MVCCIMDWNDFTFVLFATVGDYNLCQFDVVRRKHKLNVTATGYTLCATNQFLSHVLQGNFGLNIDKASFHMLVSYVSKIPAS
jgi:hypothetical protein